MGVRGVFLASERPNANKRERGAPRSRFSDKESAPRLLCSHRWCEAVDPMYSARHVLLTEVGHPDGKRVQAEDTISHPSL